MVFNFISKKGIVLVKNGQIEIALYEDRFQQAYIVVSYGVFFDLGCCSDNALG
ncbi:MAG: hypothetical protein BAJALOKI2v1_700001 [Promethearchaeota archaeon]|nr:MAG: hypothetical protein BAJALOKI2v1_700001 [Candidatus Lokiarchaeota archaeon]